jgi:beta-glucosidase
VTSSLPDGASLAFGVATAAYQIEGATTEDGRGPSIWDTFAVRPGTVRDGQDGSVACDSYHRYDEDLDLIAGLGAGWYRFSIAWPRVLPDGTGRVEPWCAAYLGYSAGVHAPGRREGGAGHVAAHHLLLAHGLAAARLHEAGVDDVGIVLNLAPFWPEDPDDAQLVAVTDQVDAVRNRVWLGPLVEGRYDDGLLAVAPELADPGVVRDGDLALVRGSADWLGVNYYTPFRTAEPGAADAHPEADAYPGVAPVSFVVREPRTDIGWEVDASGLEELLVDTHRRTGLPLMVTENGAAYPDDVLATDGSVDDQDRIAYLRDHVAATERARAAGADVRAYIVWTLLDNFEWAEGYTKTFGIVHVDPADQTRTPKASFHWIAQHISGSAATP